MSDHDRPRGRDARVVALIVAGRTARETADEVGCSLSTVTRTRARWRDLITEQRDEIAEQAAAAMLAAVPRAAARMVALVESPVPGIALAASRYIVDSALRWRDQTEVERRLAALEASAPQRRGRPWGEVVA